MAYLVLTFVGDDRAGLVSALSGVITDHAGNWERGEISELAGKFAGIVLVSVPDQNADRLISDLAPLEEQGLLDVTVQVAAIAEPDAETTHVSLELMGTDRAGIVHEITEVLAAHEVNIVQLHTDTRDAPMAGGKLFEAQALLEVATDADLAAIESALEALANELMVDITLSPEPD